MPVIRRIMAAIVCVVALLLPGRAVLLAAEHTKDSLDDVKQRVKDKKAILLDVREKKEWDDGHLRDAKLIPLSDLKKGVDADKLAKDLPKDKIIYCHCAGGVRCLPAADILKKSGYDVRPLKPGYKDLLNAGFPKAEKK
jgi:rhodanese-related sulfurtransferase